MPTLDPILPENQFIASQLKLRKDLINKDPRLVYPWWRSPCIVRVLLVANEFLDFGTSDFGLSTFVGVLKNDGRSYVQFAITLAHRGGFVGNPGVSVERSIPNFRFDNADHFTADMYDQVWLFGADRGEAENQLGNGELSILTDFMDGGGGVFATGDHGNLGKSLCGSVSRVREMRLWDNSSGKVGMVDPQRNDTNQIGRNAGSQFDDQSDDIPQNIAPKMYSSSIGGFWRETYPHPLLCSPLGRITVLPDHAHEGECIAPTAAGADFPGSTLPEIIAWSTVPSGNNSSGIKQATQSHTFGAISAYDGHQAGVGRVVTDATWHHFVNVNLIGEHGFDTDGNRFSGEHPAKQHGFLYSAAGQAHFAQIKHYYVNIAVWISRSTQITCFNNRLIWNLAFHHRVLEATMNDARLDQNRVSSALMFEIGTHADDVLGRTAGQCRRLKLYLDVLYPEIPDLIPSIDPWVHPFNSEREPELPWINMQPLFGIALGGGLLAVRDRYMDDFSPDKVEDGELEKVFRAGVRNGLARVEESLRGSLAILDSFRRNKG